MPFGFPLESAFSFAGIPNINVGIGETGTFANRVPVVPLLVKDPNCHCINRGQDFILNRAAWTDSGPDSSELLPLVTATIAMPAARPENLGVGRSFRFTERVSFGPRHSLTSSIRRASSRLQ